MNIHFKLRGQGKLNPKIILQVFDKRFKARKFMYSTGIDADYMTWDKRKGRIKINPSQPNWELSKKINDQLATIEKKVSDFMIDRYFQVSIERDELKAYLNEEREVVQTQPERNSSQNDTKLMFKLWKEFIDSAKGKSGEPITSGTRRSKTQTLELVKKYCDEKKTDLSFSTLDTSFYNAIDSYMISKGLNGNTRGKHFKEIKAILREAQDRDIMVNLSFQKKSFKVIRGSADSTFLSSKEIRTIFELDLPPALAEKRDLFVMACFLGLRHGDWHQIRESNIIKEGNKELLRVKQQKTTDIIHIPIHTAVRSILNKYQGEPPAVVTNQKFNGALKEIAKKAELGTITINGQVVQKWKHISTHTARRSFATNAYLSKTMDVYQIMKCTGHKSESSFLKYLKLDGRDFAVQAAESKFFNDKSWNTLKIAS